MRLDATLSGFGTRHMRCIRVMGKICAADSISRRLSHFAPKRGFSSTSTQKKHVSCADTCSRWWSYRLFIAPHDIVDDDACAPDGRLDLKRLRLSKFCWNVDDKRLNHGCIIRCFERFDDSIADDDLNLG